MFGRKRRNALASVAPISTDDLDLLHYRFMRVSAAIHDSHGALMQAARDAGVLLPTQVVDAAAALESRFNEAVTLLDSLIPGGCPNERA